MSNLVVFSLIILLNFEVSTALSLLGKRIEKGQFPWLLQFKTVVPCGGVLITSEWILTAAQCVQSDEQSIWLQAVGLNGTASRQIVNVKYAYIFPEFKYDLNTQDPSKNIALVKLVKPFNLSDGFRPLDIEPGKTDENYKSCFIVGWQSYVGLSKKVFAKHIHYSRIVLNSWEYCAYMYKGNASFSNVFCTMIEYRGEKMACAGNPGTPVVCEQNQRMVLLGIASWTKFSFDCGGLPSYLNVNMFREWMYDILVNASRSSKNNIENHSEELKNKKHLKNYSVPIELSKFSGEDVFKILNEPLRETLNSGLLVGNIKEREESLREYQEVDENKEYYLREINDIKEVNTNKQNFDDSNEILPFIIECSSSSSPFISIYLFKYEVTILSLIFTYLVLLFLRVS